MLHFTFLGTSSGVPTLSRNVSALAIKSKHSKDWILIDVGEGTQHRIQQAKLSLQNLLAICITHVHGDHCYGLLGLLASAGMSGRKTPLTLIAPIEIQQWLEATCTLTELYLPYPIHFIDVTSIHSSKILNEYLSIQSYPLHHRVPSYAFAITAKHTQHKLDTVRLEQLGIARGKAWGDLQQGKDIECNGQVVYSKDVTHTEVQQVCAIVAGDNDQPELLKDACQHADLLIHETTYTQTVLDKVGATPMHSSAKMVAEFADSVKLKNLIATHISPRFHDADGLQTIHDEILQFYLGNFFIADDFAQYQLDENSKLFQVVKTK